MITYYTQEQIQLFDEMSNVLIDKNIIAVKKRGILL